jgi:hypothetical protein
MPFRADGDSPIFRPETMMKVTLRIVASAVITAGNNSEYHQMPQK